MSEWSQTTIGEIAEIFDGPHATPEKISHGPWFLSISSLDRGRLKLDESAHISEADFEKWTRRVTPTEGDVLFSYETRLGEAALMPPGIRACLGRRMALLRPRRERVHPRFLLYAYLAPQFQQVISERAIRGATVDRIPLSELPRWPIGLPSLSVQRAISALLGSLDDKIAVNERISGAAEDLCIALASEELWIGRARLGDLVELAGEQITPASLGVSKVAHYSLPAFDSARLPEIVAPDEIKSAKFQLSGNALLISKLNPLTPRIWIFNPEAELPAVASTEFLVLKPLVDVSVAAIWAVCSQPRFWSELASKATGTSNSHQRVRPAEVLALSVVDPRLLTDRVRLQISNLASRAMQARIESRKLAELRDTLLPKLMSGEIRVRDAEREVENAL